MELKAELYEKLGTEEDYVMAETVLHDLLKRLPDQWSYYMALFDLAGKRHGARLFAVRFIRNFLQISRHSLSSLLLFLVLPRFHSLSSLQLSPFFPFSLFVSLSPFQVFSSPFSFSFLFSFSPLFRFSLTP